MAQPHGEISEADREAQKPVRITLPFKDQKSADGVRKQLKDLGKKIGTEIQPVYTSAKIWRVRFKNKTMPLPRGKFFFSKMHHSPHVPGGFLGVYPGSTPGKANDKCITSERNLSEFSTHMVYFSHSHVCVKCRKRARNFFSFLFFFFGGGGWVCADKSLLDCESMD